MYSTIYMMMCSLYTPSCLSQPCSFGEPGSEAVQAGARSGGAVGPRPLVCLPSPHTSFRLELMQPVHLSGWREAANSLERLLSASLA